MKFIRDLYMGVGNQNWELSRVSAGIFTLLAVIGVAWNMSLGVPFELGPTGLLGGLGTLAGGLGVWTYVKDRARAEVTTMLKEVKKK